MLETHDSIQSFDLINPVHIQQPMIQQVVDELCGSVHCVSTGESAIRTTWVMEQLLSEYYQ